MYLSQYLKLVNIIILFLNVGLINCFGLFMYISVLYIITNVIRRSVKCQHMRFVNVIYADVLYLVLVLFLYFVFRQSCFV